jgi:hypothetical protein
MRRDEITAPREPGESSVLQRRMRAWQAWLAIAGLVGHLLAMVAMSGGAHAASWVVDPATGQRLAISLCTPEGMADAPGDDGRGTPHATQAHDCVLCSIHAGGRLGPSPAIVPAFGPPEKAAWAAATAAVPDGRPARAAWPRGPPSLG